MRKPVIAVISIHDMAIFSRFGSVVMPAFLSNDKNIKHSRKQLREQQSQIGRWLAENFTKSAPGQAVATSISHRQHWVACLAAPQTEPVGLDLETLQERDAPALMEMLLTDSERKLLIEGDPNPLFNFYRCWTLKEALGKQSRLGWDAPKATLDLSLTQQCCSNLWIPELQLMLAYALSPGSATPELNRILADGNMQPLAHVHLPWHA